MRKFLTFFLVAPFFFYLNSQNTPIYVHKSATGLNSGTSWANAYIHLNDALISSSSGDTIWVAEGIYKPTTTGNRDISFVLKSNVALYGGFKGNEQHLSERNWELNPTILSGDIGVLGDSSDNSRTILHLYQPDSLTLIDGITFSDGNAEDPNSGAFQDPKISGGAIFIDGDNSIAYAVIRNCIFENNHAFGHGGAVFIRGQGIGSVAPQFLNCTFKDNDASTRGGAVYRIGSSWAERKPDFGDCTFIRNRAGGSAGALFWEDAERTDTMQLYNCSFIENQAGVDAGGAIRFEQGRMDGNALIFKNLYFENNKIVSPGTVSGTEMFINTPNFFNGTNYVEFSGLEVRNSEGHIGFQFFIFPTIQNDYNVLKIENAVFQNIKNKEMFLAEFTEINFSDFTILNTDSFSLARFASTSAFNQFFHFKNFHFKDVSGLNAFYISKATQNADPFGIYFNNISFRDCPINLGEVIENGFGAGAYMVNNSIFYNHKSVPTIAFSDRRRVQVKNTIIQNSEFFQKLEYIDFEHCSIDTASIGSIPTTIDIDSLSFLGIDPLFLDTTANNFRLHPCSPLINAGTNQPIQDLSIDTDLDGNPRIVDGIVDIGPYESSYAVGTMGTAQITAACFGLAEGAVHIAPDGGCPPYAIDWTRTNDGSTGTDTTMLLAGDYLFTITDARGRSVELPLSIEGSSPELSLSGDSTACAFIANGFLESHLLDAEQPVDYQWNTGDTVSNIQNLQQGIYSLSITDAYGCTDTASLEVTATPPVIAVVDIQDATGVMNADGAIHFEVSSGYAPFEYLWSNGATTDSISGLLSGNYRVTVEDANGCAYVFVYDVSWSVSSDLPTLSEQLNTVFPNPVQVNQPINLQFSAANRWRLMDAYGSVLVDLALEKDSILNKIVQVELPCRASGTYFWAFYEKGEIRETGRLVLE